MFKWAKDKLSPGQPSNMVKNEDGKPPGDRAPSSDENAQKRFSREHGKKVRAREKELERQGQGKIKMYIKGNFVAIGGGVC
ncbi:uncharacterized protein N7529_011971 [Penicillium soppii]|jgi:hypothetical protein|uniref:uncharacterized protein n=1 Tax=Penicillium soppii TaxID=69789 RepID=UPI0025489BF3|nr:uncharacterized protein N7529_011971 [Penicillium soppii]KAJ5852586.1 hypothetical protein N7529_011971 [Penicillium soppii]